MDEKKLIIRLREGDDKAHKFFYDKYAQTVFRTILGFVHDITEAEDLVQEVFITAYQSIHAFRYEAKLSTWLYRIAVNKSLNYIRETKKSKLQKSIESFFGSGEREQFDIRDPVADPETSFLQNEKALKLHNAIDSLPDNQKQAFILHKFEDLPYKEIAAVMKISLPAVESLIFRAKQNLQKSLISYYKQ